jgi:hypothetical protein
MGLTALPPRKPQKPRKMWMEHNLPVVEFDFKVKGNIRRVVSGERVGTLVTNQSFLNKCNAALHFLRGEHRRKSRNTTPFAPLD